MCNVRCARRDDLRGARRPRHQGPQRLRPLKIAPRARAAAPRRAAPRGAAPRRAAAPRHVLAAHVCVRMVICMAVGVVQLAISGFSTAFAALESSLIFRR